MGTHQAGAVIGTIAFSAIFFFLTPIVIKWMYEFQRQYKTYSMLGEENSSETEPLSTKMVRHARYYSVIGISALVGSFFLNSLDMTFSFGGLLGGQWSQPISILFMQGFILMVFSSIRIISLSDSSLSTSDYGLSREAQQELSEKLHGYLFSFLLTSYFLFMYQFGRALISGRYIALEFNLTVSESILFLLIAVFLPYPISIGTELYLSKMGVRSPAYVKSEK